MATPRILRIRTRHSKIVGAAACFVTTLDLFECTFFRRVTILCLGPEPMQEFSGTPSRPAAAALPSRLAPVCTSLRARHVRLDRELWATQAPPLPPAFRSDDATTAAASVSGGNSFERYRKSVKNLGFDMAKSTNTCLKTLSSGWFYRIHPTKCWTVHYFSEPLQVS